MALACSTRASLAAENLFLRKQLAFYVERKAKSRRLNDTARIAARAIDRLATAPRRRATGDARALAPSGIPAVLAVAIPPPRSSADSSRPAGPDCRQGAREPDLG
jgi:hypothetical protein